MDDAVRIAFETGLPYAGLRDFEPDERLLAAVPPAWARARRVVPLALDGDRLTLATARPDPDLTGLDPTYTTTLVISPAGEIASALARLPRPETAHAQMAQRLGLPVVDLREHQPDHAALAVIDPVLQRRLRCLPLAVDAGTVYIAIADPLDPGQLTALRAAAGERDVRLLAADAHALDELLLAFNGDRWATAIHLRRDATTRHRVLAALAVLAVVAGLLLAPLPTAIVLIALVALTVLVALVGLLAPPTPGAAPTGAPPSTTTLLLCLRDGVGATVHAATTLAALDHPPDEVLLLVDAHDAAAHRAAQALARDTSHRVIATPSTLPPEREAMLAFGRLLARGAHVAVLDPGDFPAPQLLRSATAALARDPRLTAVQARIVPRTGGRRAATAAVWHRALAPGLARLHLPVPLSSTATVVRRDVPTSIRRTGTIPDAVATTR
jgi:hypothetical protein